MQNITLNNEPTLTIDDRGTKWWRLHGKFHRVDGPAAEYVNGSKLWLLHGRYHRVDGPAIEYGCGDKLWWLNGDSYTFDGWLEANKFISEEEKLMLKLIYG
jgi:hypothetical protein